jgi:hypothetical protein
MSVTFVCFSLGDLTETEIRTRYINPNLKAAGWDLHRQVREEFTFTAGPVIVHGPAAARGKEMTPNSWTSPRTPRSQQHRALGARGHRRNDHEPI